MKKLIVALVVLSFLVTLGAFVTNNVTATQKAQGDPQSSSPSCPDDAVVVGEEGSGKDTIEEACQEGLEKLKEAAEDYCGTDCYASFSNFPEGCPDSSQNDTNACILISDSEGTHFACWADVSCKPRETEAHQQNLY